MEQATYGKEVASVNLMKKISFLVLVIVCILSRSGYGQKHNADSTELKLFYEHFVTPLLDKDMHRVKEIVYWPLKGDWGNIMNFTKPKSMWTEDDFYINYDKLFNEAFVRALRRQTWKNIDMLYRDNGGSELLIGVRHRAVVGGFKEDSTVIFRYKRINGHWKLYYIQKIGNN